MSQAGPVREGSQESTGLAAMLAHSSVIVCCGSGGVGKTTTAAAIGREAARMGRRTVVVTIDPARRLADALGLVDGLTAEPQRVEGAPGELWAMMLDTAEMFRTVVSEHAGDPAQAERILSNRFARNLSTTLSGTQEYMATEALYRLHADGRFDRVVGSDVLADAVTFFQAFAGMESGFRDRARAVDALLRARGTLFVVVASPRADTVTEALWFAEQLSRHGLSVAATLINRVHPTFGAGSIADAEQGLAAAESAGDQAVAELWRRLVMMRTIAEAERVAVQPLTELMAGIEMVWIPLMAADVHDAAGLDEIGRHLLAKGAESR